MSILARKDLGRGRSETAPNGASSCRYPGSLGSVTISLGAQSRAEFEDFRKLLVDQGKKPDSIAGIGDAAFFWDDNALYALSGKTGIKVSSSPMPGTPPVKIRSDLVAVAKALVGKLKG